MSVAGYIVVEIEVTDPVGYEEYRRLAPPTVAEHGGRYLVRGGASETLEGGWAPRRLVVLEFPSVEKAREWWSCESYAGLKALRQRTAKTRMVLIEGV